MVGAMRLAIPLILLTACAEPATSAKHATGNLGTPSARAATEHRVVISRGRRSGELSLTDDHGKIAFVYHVLQNGRGPHIEGTLVVAPDGTLRTFTASGHHEMGTKVVERFERLGDRATWKSEEEAGDTTVSAAAFFVPIADLPTEAWLVPAALKAGGTIALLPSGEARVAKATEIVVTAGGQTRKLVGYAIDGLGLTPQYAWFNEDGTWFGNVQSWRSVIPAGWESAIPPLVARQDELDRARGVQLAKDTAHTPPAAGLAYTHARVLDVAAGTWRADQTVVVVGDTIRAVGAKVTIPSGAEIVDLAGKSLLPGLIDMHSHTEDSDGVLDIASGVTTVRDVGNDPDQLDDRKHRFDTGAAVGPHIVRMGLIEGRGDKAAAAKITAETPGEAKAAVEFFARRGYDGIKIYNSMKVELVPVLTEAAHAKGMLVTGHVPVHMLANEAVRAGYDGIEHINMLFLNFFATHETDTRDTTRFTLVGEQGADLDLDGEAVRELFALLAQHHIVIDPTLGAFEDLFAGVAGKITPGLEDTVARLPLQVQRGFLIGGLPLEGGKHERFLKSWDKLFAMVKAMWRAKLHVVVGTDNIGGVMLHHELALFVRAGIPAAEVIRMATLDAARAMRIDDKIGSIAAGKVADLVVVDGDPVTDIRAITKVVSTMRGGIVFASAPLYRAVGVRP